MKLKKIQWNQVLPVFVLFFLLAYVFSSSLKIWINRGLMEVGFFKPDVPQIKADGNYSPAPDIQLYDIKNDSINLPDKKGKVVFINFWATWCPPCLAELPSINALYQKEKNNPNVVFITVDVDGDLPASTRFLQIKDYDFPVYKAPGAEQLYHEGIPTTLVINKKGKIVFKHFNRANYDSEQFAQFIDKLTRQP
jgi:thiol-disulfide isomerase/thioredoxin